jgi:hypothetical protein
MKARQGLTTSLTPHVVRDALVVRQYVRRVWDEKGWAIVERSGDEYEVVSH